MSPQVFTCNIIFRKIQNTLRNASHKYFESLVTLNYSDVFLGKGCSYGRVANIIF